MGVFSGYSITEKMKMKINTACQIVLSFTACRDDVGTWHRSEALIPVTLCVPLKRTGGLCVS